MDTIDMHVHSTASDGTFTPTEVANLALDAGLKAFALTDHDTTNGINEVMSLSLPIEIIPGIELSAGFGKGDIHILGYYINPECKELKKLLNSWLTNVYGVMKKWRETLMKQV